MAMAEPDAEVFTYTPIDLDGPSFRLLRILKGQGITICCEIFQAYLTRADDRKEAISYEALSYVWGSNKKERTIEISGKRFWVTVNLYNALQQLQLPGQDRIVWADAICIDQSNENERGHQVRHMSQIYKRASRVVYWMGSPTWETNHCLYALRALEKRSRGVARKDWTREQWLDLWNASRGTNRAQQREGLRDLLGRPWFRRVWILQEVANSHAAMVCCGKAFVSARIFGMAPYLMGLRPVRHCQAILDMMPGPFRQTSWFGEKQDLATLLYHFGSSEATDPRDLIFALLGMATDAFGHITVSYDKGNELSVLETVFRLLFRVELHSLPAASKPTELREFCGRVTHYAEIALETAIRDKSSPEATAFITQKFPRLPIRFSTLLCAARYAVNARDTLETLLTSMSPQRPPDPWYLALTKAAASNEATTGKQAVELFLDQSPNETPITEDIVVAAARNRRNGADLMHLFLAHHRILTSQITSNVLEAAAGNVGCGEEVVLTLLQPGVKLHLTENVLRAAASNTVSGKSIIELLVTEGKGGDQTFRIAIENILTWVAGLADGGKVSLVRQATSSSNACAILKHLLDWIPIGDNRIAQQSLVKASQKSLDCVKLLVAHGANVDIPDMAELETTPLANAAAFGQTEIVRFLLDNNANARQVNSRGALAIHIAAGGGFGDIITMLLERPTLGFSVESRDGYDWTPLHYAAAKSPNIAVVDLLIQHGAHVNTTAFTVGTPLSVAARAGNVNLCCSLLDHNADIELGHPMPLFNAVDLGHIEVTKLLLSRGANTEAMGKTGSYYRFTPLMYAASEGKYPEIVALLLAYGANPYSKGGSPWKSMMKNAFEWAYQPNGNMTSIIGRRTNQLCIDVLEKHRLKGGT